MSTGAVAEVLEVPGLQAYVDAVEGGPGGGGGRGRGGGGAAPGAAAELGLEPAEPLEVKPYPQARNRHLHALLKVGSTPPRFPRRPGVARKRPLGRSREQAGSRAAPSDREQR